MSYLTLMSILTYRLIATNIGQPCQVKFFASFLPANNQYLGSLQNIHLRRCVIFCPKISVDKPFILF